MAWRARGAGALQRAWWAPQPTPLAMVLRPLSLLYRMLAALDRALTRPRQLGLPVLVVGNLVVGGAGKTPTVIALVQQLRSAGWTPGVVSRGYGRRQNDVAEVHADSLPADVGDEPLLIRLRTGAPVFVGSDRVAAARALRLAHPAVNIVLSDDGLQHRRLARDLEIVVFDERGAGNGLLLPAGPLREPLPAALSARTLLLYNADAPSVALPGWTAARELRGVLAFGDWARGAASAAGSWSALRGRRLVAAAGVAAPERFFAALRAQGLDIDPLPLPDHHAFDTLPWPPGTPDVVVTEKDAVKLRRAALGATRLWVAPLDLVPEAGFMAAVQRHFPPPATP
jgi:tetraacyldisaccharide 4'-kinase